MYLSRVRETFEKASVILSNNRLSIHFARVGDLFIDQSIADDLGYKEATGCKMVFESMIRNSDAVILTVMPSGQFRMDFTGNGEANDGNTLWYLPLSPEITLEELEEQYRAYMATPHALEFGSRLVEFFQGVDKKNEDEVGDRLIEWISVLRGPAQDLPVPEDRASKWDDLYGFSREFYSKIVLGSMETEEPDGEDMFGCVRFAVDAQKQITWTLKGKAKDLFFDMVHASDSVNIRVGDDGKSMTYLTLEFFV